MGAQTTLLGDSIDLEDKVRIQEEFCCEACMDATEDECTCRCGGLFHGISHKKVEGY